MRKAAFLIATELSVREEQVQAAIELLDQGSTVPSSPDTAGMLDDAQLRTLEERLRYLRELDVPPGRNRRKHHRTGKSPHRKSRRRCSPPTPKPAWRTSTCRSRKNAAPRRRSPRRPAWSRSLICCFPIHHRCNAKAGALGSRHVFNTLSQEKTGDFWVNGHMFGRQTCHTAEDVHHRDPLLVIWAIPWITHQCPRPPQLDPQASLTKTDVVDARRSETAEMADLHLSICPGTDAFFLGALLATLVRSDGPDHDFIARHTLGFEEVKQALLAILVAQWAAVAEISLADLERCAQLIRAAKGDGGAGRTRHPAGHQLDAQLLPRKAADHAVRSFGRSDTNQLHSWLVPLWGNSPGQKFAPTGDEVIGGLLPPNIFAEAVLSDHPDRLRGVWIDSSNPANTAADTDAVERAPRALDLCVVVDVTLTETAHVLPASSQYEKTEFTLFNFEFPVNYFQVRAAVLPPLAGTLPEPEIYIARALSLLPGDNALAPLRDAATRSRTEFALAFRGFIGEHPGSAAMAPLVLHHTLGPTLPDGVAAATPLWNAALCAPSARRARCGGRSGPGRRLRIQRSEMRCSTGRFGAAGRCDHPPRL